MDGVSALLGREFTHATSRTAQGQFEDSIHLHVRSLLRQEGFSGRNRYCVRALWAPRLRLVK